MNLGVITQTNTKGQIVLPKAYRDQLGITPLVPLQVNLRSDGLYIKTLDTFMRSTSNNSYLEILKKTVGAWAGDDWDRTAIKRAKIEKKASIARKKIW